MRIVIITQGLSPIVVPLTEACSVVGVVEARPRQHKKDSQHSGRIRLGGLRKALGQFVGGRLRRYCAKSSIPYWYMSDGCSDALQQWLTELNPDLICVYSMSELLRENIFRIPQYGTINLHPSLLPRYRGPNPYFWILLDEEQESGVTIHYIDKGEDTGDVLAQEAFPVSDEMTVSELQSVSVTHGVQLMLRVIHDLENGSIAPISQPETSPTVRARRVKSAEYHSLIRWEEWSSARIRRLFDREVVRLSDLFPQIPTHYWWDWKTLEIVSSGVGSQPPGTIQIESGVFTLCCIDGSIRFVRHFVGMKKAVRAVVGKLR